MPTEMTEIDPAIMQGQDPDVDATQVEIPEDTEQVNLRDELKKNADAVVEKHRRENPDEQPPGEEAPPEEEAPATDATPAPDAAVEDPEFDFGEGVKFKRSQAQNLYRYAVQARQAEERFGQEYTALKKQKEEFDGLVKQIGGIQKAKAFADSLGPNAEAFYQQLDELQQRFQKTLTEDPAVAALAHKMNPMEKRVAQLEAQLAEERKMRDEWVEGQRKSAVLTEAQKYGRKFGEAQVNRIVKLAKEEGVDPLDMLREFYGPPPSGPAKPAENTSAPAAPAKTAGKPWDRAKQAASAAQPRSVPPGGGSRGGPPNLDQMNPNELLALAKRMELEIVRRGGQSGRTNLSGPVDNDNE